jgi:hypothetical protein
MQTFERVIAGAAPLTSCDAIVIALARVAEAA